MSNEPASTALSGVGTTKRPRRNAVLIALCAMVVLAVGWGWLLLRPAPAGAGWLTINGRIEGDRVNLACKYAGRVASLAVREGDRVSAGQVLARLDDQTVHARLDQAVAAHHTLQARIAAQVAALVVMRSETDLALQSAQLRIEAAEADLRRAVAMHRQDQREQARAEDLHAQGFVGPQALERAGLARELSGDLRDAAETTLAQARQAMRDARLGPQRVRAREAELAVNRSQLQEAAAALAEARVALDDLVIRTPISGTVTARFVDVGEVINAGTPIVELTDLTRLYLKAYLPEPQIGRVRRGMAGQIQVDAFPGISFAATLRYVAARAEFTPKEVQTVDERIKLVYEVHLYVDNDPHGRLNPGQPADGLLHIDQDLTWRTPQP